MRNFYLLLVALILAWASIGRADLIDVIPRPVLASPAVGSFTITSDTVIVARGTARPLADDLSSMLAPAMGFALKINPKGPAPKAIRLTIDPANTLGGEGYQLLVTSHAVTISSSAPAGLYHGLQTLRQLLPPRIFSPTKVAEDDWTIPAVRIEDYPRFAWRGLMLDCSRHFFDKQFIQKFIDLIALHKMNTFHWHLTDDQGWRIQIRKYPRLTTVGAFRKQTIIGHPERGKPGQYDGTPYGGFYTQNDIREIVKYAADRFINVVPEIEMPGHSAAAIAAYPQLGSTSDPVAVWTSWGVNPNTLGPSEFTIHFYQDVLSEVLELFPSAFIHVGGDEVRVTQWDNSPSAQARIKELGLKDSHDLEPYFLGRMAVFLHDHGRRMVGWDEVSSGKLPSDSIIMCWRGIKSGTAGAMTGHDIVVAADPITYFDHYQTHTISNEPLTQSGVITLQTIYNFDPMPPGLTAAQSRHVLGTQGQMWSEYVSTPADVEYMVFPRACALAEDAWTPAAAKNFDDFQARLIAHLQRLDELRVHYRHPSPTDERPAADVK